MVDQNLKPASNVSSPASGSGLCLTRATAPVQQHQVSHS